MDELNAFSESVNNLSVFWERILGVCTVSFRSSSNSQKLPPTAVVGEKV